MRSDVDEVTEGLENELCSHSFSYRFVALPTSQLILQHFRFFNYVTAHSPTLLSQSSSPLLASLHLRHRLFTFVICRAAHGQVAYFC